MRTTQQIEQTPIFTKRHAVQLFLAAHGVTFHDLNPESVEYWLTSPENALKVAAILLGLEHRPDAVLKGRPS